MSTVTLHFDGEGADRVAARLYSWLVDGGLEDTLLLALSDEHTILRGISAIDNETREVRFACEPRETRERP